MKKIDLTTTFQIFDQISEMEVHDQQLILAAKEGLKDSYSPYSKFKVGAAILLSYGKIIKGSNQENAAYPMCLCAERVAIAAADAMYPKETILAIAVTAKSPTKPIDKPIAPCGACRQVLCETENKHNQKMKVIMQGEVGDIILVNTAKDLLPLSFDSEIL